MGDLFGAIEMKRSARLSGCGTYRWRLEREWSIDGGQVCWIMLNPSTADGTVDDPTLRRCIAFSRSWGYGRLVVVNLYPFRSPDPRALRHWLVQFDVTPHHPNDLSRNLDQHVIPAVAKADLAVAAWGAGYPDPLWPEFVREEIDCATDKPLHHIGLTAGGDPKHPLARGAHRVPDDTKPQPWR